MLNMAAKVSNILGLYSLSWRGVQNTVEGGKWQLSDTWRKKQVWFCREAFKMEKCFVNCNMLYHYASLVYNRLALLKHLRGAPDLALSWHLWKPVWIGAPREQLWPLGAIWAMVRVTPTSGSARVFPDSSQFSSYSRDAVHYDTSFAQRAWCHLHCVHGSPLAYRFLNWRLYYLNFQHYVHVLLF